MLTFNQKNIGALLVGFSIILLFILAFVKINVDNQGVFLCDAVHSNPNLKMEDCPVHKTNTSWLIIASFGIAFLTLASGIYLIFMPAKVYEGGIKEYKNIDLSKLDEEESLVYTNLKQKQGSMYQSDLIKETGFSKVQMTRVLDKMMSKDILDRKRRGMTNIVVLK